MSAKTHLFQSGRAVCGRRGSHAPDGEEPTCARCATWFKPRLDGLRTEYKPPEPSPPRTKPLGHGWYSRLDRKQKDRVDLAVRRALNSRPSFEALSEATGIRARALQDLRGMRAVITGTHLEKLAPMLGTSAEAVLSGEWKPGQI